MRILFIADPVSTFELAGDTTYALMLEATRRGHEIWTCEVEHLGLEHDVAVALAQPTTVRPGQTADESFAQEPATTVPLDAFDVVMMRKDPPVNMAYLHATWLLERARGRTVLVNDPRGLRELNEHLSILEFPDLIPPTIVTSSVTRLGEFMEEQDGAIIVKPIEGHGGAGIFLVRSGDPNTSSIFETATEAGRNWTMAQKYLPDAVKGDKRILLIDGKPLGAVLRVPPANEARGNLHVGGRAEKTELDAADRRIVEAVAPMLDSYGQIFVGLDVIGGMLTEINITSPTGIRHIDALDKVNSSEPVIECFERKAAALQR